ncbi:poly polymerase catalytic domain-containing protein [Dichotomopilus funicola]|uniref:Poly [ADP-ribose] polymerase n=1 Tax=Dichotomopilus funicola TaxID=1934379 RepID=A0AAN6ZIL5_9PEZI|nr:poly polymerase catalytic domain-containing protein [Dichotomopilus funicola]
MAPRRGSKPALDGCRVALSGTFQGTTHATIKTRAEALGATVGSRVADDTTHLIATEADYDKPSPKVSQAQSLDIHIVTLDWLQTCETQNAKATEKYFVPHWSSSQQVTGSSQSQTTPPQTNNTTTARSTRSRKRAPSPAANDASGSDAPPKSKKTRGRKTTMSKTDPADDDSDAPDAINGATQPADEKQSKQAKVEKAVGEGQVAKSKDLHIPLDEGCPFFTSKVYISPEGVIYDASLNQTNASHNNNKFYRIQQLLQSSGVFHTWTRWGRVGERGQTAYTSSSSLDGAMRQFEKKFKDKSSLAWKDRGNPPKPGKYAFVEKNYDEDSDDDEGEGGDNEAEQKKASTWEPPKSALEPAVQTLMELIFNQQYFNATMSSLNYDANKLPLGKLSKATITRGFQTLKDLSALIDEPGLATSEYGTSFHNAVENLSNTFYSVIPHAFGRNRPPVINTHAMLKTEIELLESLSDMKDAALLMKVDKSAEDEVHPLDRHYQALKMQEMTPLDPTSNEYTQLQNYLVESRGSTHGHQYAVESIFRIERQGETERFDGSFGKMNQNRRLLWHGSRCTNFGGILSQGLRIAPPEAPVSGYMFGKGIYLADMASKSANYCCSYISGGTALLLLCEAELGDPMQELVNASYTAGEDAKGKGMISTWGQGSTGPSQWKDASCVHPSLAGVKMPDTSVVPGPTNVPNAGLYYNEYICYDVSQVRLRYLLRVRIISARGSTGNHRLFMSTSPRPQKRTNTCVTCRARKVRCDGRRGICTNCERLSFSCSYDENVGVEVVPGEGSVGNAISVPRRRVRQACQNCHARKARCSGSMPSCDRCRAQRLECVYRPGKRALPLPLPTPTAAPSPGSSAMDLDSHASGGQSAPHPDDGTSSSNASPATTSLDPTEPDEALALKAFDHFFRHVYHVAMFSFLHRPSLMELYHAGSLDRALVLAVVGVTSLLTDLGPGMVDYGNRCIDEAMSLCLAGLEKPTISRLQALVLVIKHRILSKRFSGAFMLHAIASRFATAMRLYQENTDLCFLAREARRRLMWTIFMIDASISIGQADVALWFDAEHQIHLQLPCNERNFDFDLPDPTEGLRGPGPDPTTGIIPPIPDVLGLMALHIRLYWMRTRILQCASKMTASPSSETVAALPAQLAEFATELEVFEARLPASFRENEANFRLRSYSTRLNIFITTHLLWRQCHLDLYRLFLPGLKDALSPTALQQLDPHFVLHKRRSCYEHARGMADMFSQLLSLSSTCASPPVADLDLPGCAFQCSKVLYHGLQTDNAYLGFTEERVRELANLCFRAARQSTPGPASTSIQADIERLITNGLSLPEVPLNSQPGRARNLGPGTGTPYLAAQGATLRTEHPGLQQLLGPTPSGATPVDQVSVGSMQMPPPSSLGPIASALNIPMPEAAGPGQGAANAGVAPSQASAITTGSNAFEELPDALNFGPEFFGMESWSALSHGWADIGHFTGTGMS